MDGLENVNIIELLMQIREDVSSIKTDMANVKESQRTEKESTYREIEDVRSDCNREIGKLKEEFNNKLRAISEKQDKIFTDVEELKDKDDRNAARKWNKATSYILVAAAGMIISRLPDFITFLIQSTGK